jgi:hypothetical protein
MDKYPHPLTIRISKNEDGKKLSKFGQTVLHNTPVFQFLEFSTKIALAYKYCILVSVATENREPRKTKSNFSKCQLSSASALIPKFRHTQPHWTDLC